MDKLSTNPPLKWYQSLEDDVFWVKNKNNNKNLLKLIINTLHKLYKIGKIIKDQLIKEDKKEIEYIASLNINYYSDTSYDDTDWQYPSP